MTVIGRFENGSLLVRETVAGPASYATASPPTIEFLDLNQLDEVLSIVGEGGHLAERVSFTGRILTFRIRGLDAAGMSDGDPMLEIPDAQDQSGSDYVAIAVGH